MHHLDFEKIIDKLGSKYEAVVRMSVMARRIADGEMPEGTALSQKITTMALKEYLGTHPEIQAPGIENKG